MGFSRLVNPSNQERTMEQLIFVVFEEYRDDVTTPLSAHSSEGGALKAAREAGAIGDGKEIEGGWVFGTKRSNITVSIARLPLKL